MARLSKGAQNRARSTTRSLTSNNAGGVAFQQSPKLELVNLILGNMLSGDMYRSEGEVMSRLLALIQTIPDKEFLAKAALYARNEFGMRTTSHIIAGELANQNFTSKTDWGRRFYNAIIHRPDDMQEIMGYYLDKNPGHALPNAVKTGFAQAFTRFDAYQLAKYRGENRSVKLVDIVRLVRPKPGRKNETALKELLEGTLKNTKTWEAKISVAGQTGTKQEKQEAKAQAWGSMIQEKQLGYLALIRNLVNIGKDSSDTDFDAALKLLVNEQAIKRSLIFPFQIYTAYKQVEISDVSSRRKAKLIDALSAALDLSVVNVPKLDGRTLVAIDISGSMGSNLTSMSKTRLIDIAALFGVVLAKACDADVVLFESTAKYVAIPKTRMTLDAARQIAIPTGGTNFESVFNLVIGSKSKYDRIFILSDMQAWMQIDWNPLVTLNRYRGAVKANPFVYSFDLNGHGTMQVPENDRMVIALAGWSEKIFDIIKNAEIDRQTILKAIENYPIMVARKGKPERKSER